MATQRGEGGKGKGQEAMKALEDQVDELFRIPLGEFTNARNALAARLKKAGHTDESAYVKGLTKPSISAWVVNQLYWKQRERFDRLMTTGERFRKAQASQLAGKSADLREPLEARRAALAELSRLAAATLRDGGGTASPEMMRRITTTLEALSTYGSTPEAPQAGRLTDDVEPPGFESLAALIPQVGPNAREHGPTRVIPFQQRARPAKTGRSQGTPAEQEREREEARKAEIAAAKASVQEAERSLRAARTTAQQAESSLKKAAARAKETEQRKRDAEQRLEKSAGEAEEARQQARRIAAEAEEAAQAVEDAERALDKAQRTLKELDS